MADPGEARTGALRRLRVVEAGGPAAATCTLWLAGLGADVVKVEPPGGDVLRSYAPFAGEIPDPDRGLFHLHFDKGKRSVVLALARGADVLVESFRPGYLEKLGLGYARLRETNPGLVLVSVTPFGQTGPHRDYLGDDLIALAASGYMTWGGDDERPPAVAPCFQAYQLGGLYGAVAALIAHRYRRASGRGQWVDVSLQEALSYAASFLLMQYMGGRNRTEREGKRNATGAQITRCQDGYVMIAPFNQRSWQSLEVEWMQDPLLSQEPWKSDQLFRRANGDVISALRDGFISPFKLWDFVHEAQRRHIPAAPVNTPAEYLASEQVRARGLVVEAEHPVVGTYKTLKAPFDMTATPWGTARPAPLLDQHREEVLGEALLAASVPRGAAVNGPRRLPLEGLRILDLTRVRAGPMGTAVLGDFGAEVIKVESSTIDTFRGAARRDPQFDSTNRNKKAITLNLKDPRAKELFLELVKQSDAVIENFTYKVMDDLGLGYEDLRRAKPDIILAGMPPMGKTGPFAPWTTYGQQLFAFSGVCYLWGQPDSPIEARAKIAYADDTAAPQMVLGLLAALEHRDRTGEGQFVEIAQGEGQAFMIAPAFMDILINGRESEPQGSWHPAAAPFGTYRCLGHDAWLAISCETEEHWRALVQGLGSPDWAGDPRFATREGRREHRRELDPQIEEWTAQHTPRQAMWLLQRAGAPAFEVSSNEDLYFDLHLRERGFVRRGSFPGWPNAEYRGPAVALSETPGQIRKGEPQLGEDNYAVLGSLLGLSRQEVDRLTEEKVIY